VIQNVRPGFISEAAWLRALACINVIIIHVGASPLYYLTNDPNTLAQYGSLTQLEYLIAIMFTRFSVPAFVFLTGFTLAWKYGRSQERFSFWSFIRHRFMVVFTPYAIWSVVYTAFSFFIMESGSVAQVGWGDLIGRFVHELLVGDALYHMYFVLIILQMYLIAPLFILVMRRRFSLPGWLAVGVVLQITASILTYYYISATGNPFWDMVINRLDRNCLMWVGYFIIGLAAGKEYPRIRGWLARFGGGFAIPWLFFWGALVWEFYYSIGIGKFYAGVISTTKPLVVLYTLSFLPFLLWAGIKLSTTRANPVMLNLSDHSYGIFLAHPVVIACCRRFFSWFNQYDLSVSALLLLLSLAIPWAATLGWGSLWPRVRALFRPQPEVVRSRSFQNPG
jgi:peptidoglycan/LPS O-acetylase OafA/YrhL